jgi:hypothetical protein
MTFEDLARDRLAKLRLERDNKGLEVIARMHNSMGTQIALLAINDQSPGWQKRFIEVRGRMDYIQAAALDQYKELCDRVRKAQQKFDEKYKRK